MAKLRPRGMSIAAFAEMMKDHGFNACSKTAVSLAERPKDSGVQFTPEARNVARGLLNSPRRRENRKNANKTTVWLDDETRIWCETRAYMEDLPIGELIRRILRNAMKKEKAATDAGTSEAAVGTEGFEMTSFSDHNTTERRNQA